MNIIANDLQELRILPGRFQIVRDNAHAFLSLEK